MSGLAESDLVGIRKYRSEEWDETHPDRNLDELDEAIRLLTDKPELEVNRDFVRKACSRRLPQSLVNTIRCSDRETVVVPTVSRIVAF